MTFKSFAEQYSHPKNRGDMKRAEKRFQRIAKAGELEALGKALEAYSAYQRANSYYHPQMLASWLGSAANPRWKEWMLATNSGGHTEESMTSDDEQGWFQMRAEGIQREQLRQVERGQRMEVMSIEQILERIKS